jgi:dihydrofolate synthase/folylpolyglutamate synthase
MIHSYAEAEDYLYNELPRTGAAVFSGGRGLERAAELLRLLDGPQEALPAIHVAGTSGKGTVCYMLDALLRAHGFRTGRFVSPHVYSLTERFAVDGEAVGQSELVRCLNDLLPAIETMTQGADGKPTFFEAATAIAFMLNRQHKVDYAVVETGLGGLYDSTNTITRTDKLAVITRLGLDHTEILGTTLAAIARQKAGIMPRGGVAVVLRPDDAGARRGLEEVATERRTELLYVSANEVAPLAQGLLGRHNQENATMALRAVEYLAQRDGFELQPDAMFQALHKLRIPGRYERRQWQGHPVILDGAHNLQKMTALCEALDKDLGTRPVAIVAFKRDKLLAPILRRLAASAAELVVTQFDAETDMKLGAASPKAVAATARQVGMTDVHTAETPVAALRLAAKLLAPGQPLVVTGSMYLLGEVAELL